ncbi:hypothetical protein MMPV_001077 [Pyropia vietnamensis]
MAPLLCGCLRVSRSAAALLSASVAVVTAAVLVAWATPAAATTPAAIPGTTCPCAQEADPSTAACYHWAPSAAAAPPVGATASCLRVACAPRYECVAQPLSTHVCHVTAVTSVPVCEDPTQPPSCTCTRSGVTGPVHLQPVQVAARAGGPAVADPPLNCAASDVVVRIRTEDEPYKCVREINTGSLSIHDAYFGGGTSTRQAGWHLRGDWVHVHFLRSDDPAVPHGVCFTNGGGARPIAQLPADRSVDISVTSPTGVNNWVVQDPPSAPSPFNATFGYTTTMTTDGLVQAARQSWPNGGPGRGFCVRMPQSAELDVEMTNIHWLRGMLFFRGATNYPLAGAIHVWCMAHSANARGIQFPLKWGRAIWPVPAGTPADAVPSIEQVTFQRACDCGGFPE